MCCLFDTFDYAIKEIGTTNETVTTLVGSSVVHPLWRGGGWGRQCVYLPIAVTTRSRNGPGPIDPSPRWFALGCPALAWRWMGQAMCAVPTLATTRSRNGWRLATPSPRWLALGYLPLWRGGGWGGQCVCTDGSNDAIERSCLAPLSSNAQSGGRHCRDGCVAGRVAGDGQPGRPLPRAGDQSWLTITSASNGIVLFASLPTRFSTNSLCHGAGPGDPDPAEEQALPWRSLPFWKGRRPEPTAWCSGNLADPPGRPTAMALVAWAPGSKRRRGARTSYSAPNATRASPALARSPSASRYHSHSPATAYVRPAVTTLVGSGLNYPLWRGGGWGGQCVRPTP